MKRYPKLVSIIVVLALLVTAGVVFMIRQHHSASSPINPATYVTSLPKIGNPVPVFALPRYPDRKTISISDYKGKPIFINFWASWCDPCKQETPDLVKAYAQYGKTVNFVGVNLTSADSVVDAKKFIHQYGIKYTVLLDVAGNVAKQYGIVGIPTSVFVNREGEITTIYMGAIPPQTLSKDLKSIS